MESILKTANVWSLVRLESYSIQMNEKCLNLALDKKNLKELMVSRALNTGFVLAVAGMQLYVLQE